MPAENLISIRIPNEELQQAQNGLKVLQDVMGKYLIALQTQDIKGLAKMSDKSIPFVDKVIDYSVSDPQFMPAFVDAEELRKDMEVVKNLTALLRPLEQLIAGISNTMTLVGSEAYKAALAYYQAVKQASKMNVSGARTIYDDLSKRFPNPKGSVKADVPTVTE